MPGVLELVVLVIAIACSCVPVAIHKVDEGHVGVYWRGGALLSSTSQPGYHVKIPFVTAFDQVQVSVQTDSVPNIPCGTSGGTVIHFDKVEVVNRLKKDLVHDTVKNYTTNYDQTWIFDKIHHEINQFCSKHTLREVYITKFDSLDENLAETLQKTCDMWAPGIEIIAVRVTKPTVPSAIRRNFEEMEAQRAQLMVATEAQKVRTKEAETEKIKQRIAAEMAAEVSKINMEQEIQEKEARKKISQLDAEAIAAKRKILADTAFYEAAKEAESNRARLTPEYIKMMEVEALMKNTKIYFGDKIPSVMANWAADGQGQLKEQ